MIVKILKIVTCWKLSYMLKIVTVKEREGVSREERKMQAKQNW